MKISTLLFLSLLLSSLALKSQDYVNEEDDKKPEPKKENTTKLIDRLVFGGNFGASFGDFTYVDISPSVGYRVTDAFTLGTGITYTYYKNNVVRPTYSTNFYGGRWFGQYTFFESIVTHVEYELLNRGILENFGREERRINVHSFFVGGGYRGSIGRNAYISLLLLYNLNQGVYTPYTNPQLRAGFGFGF